jgi:hypothetical protein
MPCQHPSQIWNSSNTQGKCTDCTARFMRQSDNDVTVVSTLLNCKQTCTISIDEFQRSIIEQALAEVVGTSPGNHMSDEDPIQEGRILRELFAALPEDDKTCPPGSVHGFTL